MLVLPGWFVAEAVVHPATEGLCQVGETAAAPVVGTDGAATQTEMSSESLIHSMLTAEVLDQRPARLLGVVTNRP